MFDPGSPYSGVFSEQLLPWLLPRELIRARPNYQWKTSGSQYEKSLVFIIIKLIQTQLVFLPHFKRQHDVAI